MFPIPPQQMARQISQQVWARYVAHGYSPIKVPAGPIEERVALILSTVRDQQ
jgi:predicted ATPase